MDENVKVFVINIDNFVAKMIIYLVWKALISLLLIKDVISLAKYSDFLNIFFKNLAKVLCKHTRTDKQVVKLEKNP